MFSFSQKALLIGVMTVAVNGLLFALDYSSRSTEGVTIHLPEATTTVAQNIPDAPIVPPSDDIPETSSSPDESSEMSSMPEMPPSAAPAPMSAPVPALPKSGAMSSSYRSNSMPTMRGDFRPGWRPAPPDTFPRNPFSGVSTMETPVAFKQEFDALAKNIIGFVEVGKNSVLIVQNRVVREGDSVKLVKEKEKGVSMSNEQVKEEAAVPVAIFSGVDKKKEVAKFMLGDIEVHVPIPSTHKKIEDANGMVSKVEGLATATLIGEKGYFVVASDLVPDVDPQKKIYIRTQFGSGTISIVKRDAGSNLALGRIDALNMIGLYNGVEWSKSRGEGETSLGTLLAYNIEKMEGLSRPQSMKLNSVSPNPKWVEGCPMFMERRILGVLTKKRGKLSLVGRDELNRLFPEAFMVTQDDKQKVEGLAPSQLKTEEGNFFNPEKLVGLIYIESEE